MTSRTRKIVLAVVALAWLFLGVANVVRGHPAIGTLYLVLGVLTGIAALAVGAGRRARGGH